MRVRRDERGFVLITAMLVLGVFMALSLALVTVVDVQADQTGHERSGEAAFDLATSALQAEAYQIQLAWPATSAQALPPCNESTPQKAGCEGAALTQELQTPTPGPDYAEAKWSAQAVDNASSTYSGPPASTVATWDSNGDNSMWVRAQATADGQTRTVVEQVTRRLETIPLPENVVTAGGLSTESNGTPPIIKATDPTSGVTGPVDVRCGTTTSQPPQTDCLDWAKPTQLNPESAYQGGYVDPGGSSSALTSAQIDSLIQRAQAAGTFYNIGTPQDSAATPGCPPDDRTYPNLPGASHPVVVVEGAGECSLKSDWFSQATPGALVFLQGSVSLGPGNPTFYGLLYMANRGGMEPAPGSVCTSTQLSTAPTLVTVAGNAEVDGAVLVDGCGLVDLQDNGDALNFRLNAFYTLQDYGTATPAAGTFRVVTQ